MRNIIGIFFVECAVLLKNLDNSLIVVSKGEGDKDVIEIIFHSIHSIHEGAAALGLVDLENFSRAFDNTLNKMCSNQLELTHSVFDTLLQSSNMLGCVFAAARDNKTYNQKNPRTLCKA